MIQSLQLKIPFSTWPWSALFSACLLTKIYRSSSICNAAFLKDHAEVQWCSPSMQVSFRLLRTIYHYHTHTQTILICIYHSMLTWLVHKTMQLRQWSNAYRLYDCGWSRINYDWMIVRRSSWIWAPESNSLKWTLIDGLSVGESIIAPVTSVRNLGSWFDQNLSMICTLVRYIKLRLFILTI